MKPFVNKAFFWFFIPFALVFALMLFGFRENGEVTDSFSDIPKADGFDFPVGKPDAKGYYNAQKFGQNNHLGDDWNGLKGGNSDFGDPIYSIANGQVTEAVQFFGGWGKVIRIAHAVEKGGKTFFYESLYAHLDSMLVKTGAVVQKGQLIGKMGNAEGQYLSHLHLEIRDGIGYDLGGGYSTITKGYLDPTKFIKANRKIQQ
jgi:murein DD-endopeptidase MepM/ murein hydrolase activator NlpD